MIVIPEERFVESPYIEWVAHGYTVADGLAMRPAEYNWHLIFTRHEGVLRTLVVGALEAARPLRTLTEIKGPVIVVEWYNSNRHEKVPS